MDIKELMIGDWVYNTHNRQPEQVCEVRERMVMLAYNDLYEYDEIEPIPLTEDLLQKHFPDPDVVTWFPLDEKPGFFNIYWECPTFGDGELRLNIRYVHELQHVLRLCGIEKDLHPCSNLIRT